MIIRLCLNLNNYVDYVEIICLRFVNEYLRFVKEYLR
jgi:hypothetical protein